MRASKDRKGGSLQCNPSKQCFDGSLDLLVCTGVVNAPVHVAIVAQAILRKQWQMPWELGRVESQPWERRGNSSLSGFRNLNKRPFRGAQESSNADFFVGEAQENNIQAFLLLRISTGRHLGMDNRKQIAHHWPGNPLALFRCSLLKGQVWRKTVENSPTVLCMYVIGCLSLLSYSGLSCRKWPLGITFNMHRICQPVPLKHRTLTCILQSIRLVRHEQPNPHV